MLSNKEAARQVEKSLQECGAALDRSIRLVMDTCPEEEFKTYRRIIGQIMGSMYLDIRRPIHRRFPDLEPEELKR
jgi:hypothetical protein